LGSIIVSLPCAFSALLSFTEAEFKISYFASKQQFLSNEKMFFSIGFLPNIESMSISIDQGIQKT
jgi:hypothetical protein